MAASEGDCEDGNAMRLGASFSSCSGSDQIQGVRRARLKGNKEKRGIVCRATTVRGTVGGPDRPACLAPNYVAA